MKKLITIIDKTEFINKDIKCIHMGLTAEHLQEFSPDCKSCTGYRMLCEQKGKYKTKYDMINQNEK